MSVRRSPTPSGSSKRPPASQVSAQPAKIPHLATPAGDVKLHHIWELLQNMQAQVVSLQEQNQQLAKQNNKVAVTIEEIGNEQIEEREALTLLKDCTQAILDKLDTLPISQTPPSGKARKPEATPRPTAGNATHIHSPTPVRQQSSVTFSQGLGSPLHIPKLSPSPTNAPPKVRRPTTPILAIPTATVKPPKMKEPDSFDGIRGRTAKQWWTKVAIWAAFQRPSYPNKEVMLLHILTMMKPGKAADWAQPLMEKIVNRDPNAPNTLSTLADLFNTVFGDPDASRATMRQLAQLHQTADANAYTTEFNNLASDLEWTDERALKAQYEQGLSFRVKSQLIQRNPYPATLIALQEAAIKIDGLYWELDQSNPRRKAQGPAEEKSKTGGEKKREAMTLEERKKLPNYVSEEEQKARKEASLCIKCGSPDHMFRECKNGWKKERVPGKGKTKETAKVAEESESEKE